jgi:hypothetical protein
MDICILLFITSECGVHKVNCTPKVTHAQYFSPQHPLSLPLLVCYAGILGWVMEGKIHSWNRLGIKYGIESAMSHKLLCLISWNLLRSWVLPPPLPRINSTAQMDSQKESVLWNRCPGSLKV